MPGPDRPTDTGGRLHSGQGEVNVPIVTTAAAPARTEAATLLVVGGDAAVPSLASRGFRVEHVPPKQDWGERARRADADCVVIDAGGARAGELEPLLAPAHQLPELALVVIGDQDDAVAVDAARLGADAFLANDGLAGTDRLHRTVRFAIERRAGLVARRGAAAWDARRRLEASLAANQQLLRYEKAVAECSRVLLRAESDKDLDPALTALRDAAGGTTIFVERNVDDPELGLCTSLVHEVSEPGAFVDLDRWRLVPWAELPESHAALSRGDMFTMNVSELGPVERQAYAGVEIKAEANAPIFVGGRWAGLVGLADRHRERVWHDSELRLLRTAAQMIGAVWDRQEMLVSLEHAVADAHRRTRYEHALFEASRALLITDDERALPAAMDALLGVTEATETFLERNVDDPELGLCTEVRYQSTLQPDGTIDHIVHPYWARTPWSQLPDSFVRLSQGEPFAFTMDDLGPIERAAYLGASEPTASEIDIPIFVDGVWTGLVGFAHRDVEWRWDETEVRLLQTAADMIGAFWSRRDAHARLRELVRKKDEFLAGVSHELRTPLTTVLGLSAELRDRPGDFEPDETAQLLGLIAGEAAEMSDLVADLLVAAREEIDAVAVHPEAIGMAAEVRGVVRALPHDKHVHVHARTEAGAWADPLRTRQIIRNLFTNALRYGGDSIRFEIDLRGDAVVVRAIDDGDPIPEAKRQLIFEPYHRAHDSTSQPASVGLGLTVARRLARLMGGDLTYRADAGNVFELSLPRPPGAAGPRSVETR